MNKSPAGYRYFTMLAGIFVSCLLVTNIASQKLISLGPFVFAAGIFLFPITYIFNDVLTETYGFRKTRQVIWTGFGASILMSAYLHLAIQLSPAPGWPFQAEFEAVMGSVPRIVSASLSAYLVGEFLNSVVLAKMKVWTSGKWLWTRTISSTIIGEAADTIVFGLVAFYGVVPNNVLVTAIWSGYLFKVLYEVVATPLTYTFVRWLKRNEGVDVYDRTTKFNPFRIGAE